MASSMKATVAVLHVAAGQSVEAKDLLLEYAAA